MARTPLFSRLRSLHRFLAASRRTGLPIDELAARAEAQRKRRAERRAFLAGTAGLMGGVVLASACKGGPGDGSVEERVTIIGGGIAGTLCAYRLSQMGISASVYDAATRLGGRMFTDRATFPDGQHCELGGEYIDSIHTTLLDLATELGVDLFDFDNAPGGNVDYFGGMRVSGADIDAGFAPISDGLSAATNMLTDPSVPVSYRVPNGATALDNLTLKAWLDGIGASGVARTVFELGATLEYGLDPDKLSFLNMIQFPDSDERFHVATGNDTFIAKLSAALQPAQINLGHKLVALAPLSDGRVLSTFDVGGVKKEVKSERVVLALPFTTLRDVDNKLTFSPVKKRAIAELGMGTNTKLMCGFATRYWLAANEAAHTQTDLGYQETWETSVFQDGDSGIVTNYTGGAHGASIADGDAPGFAQSFLSQFDKVLPGAIASHNGKVARMGWPTAPLAKGSYSVYLPGQYTAIAGSEGEVEGNVHFCGEQGGGPAQGFMEGGALTGTRAAMEVAAALGMSKMARRIVGQARGLRHARI